MSLGLFQFAVLYASLALGVACHSYPIVKKQFSGPVRFHHGVGFIVASIFLGLRWPFSLFEMLCRKIAKEPFR